MLRFLPFLIALTATTLIGPALPPTTAWCADRLPKQHPELVIQRGHSGEIQACAFSPDGQLVLTGGADGCVLLWHVNSEAILRRFDGHTADVVLLAFIGDGSQFAAVCKDSTVRFWETSSGKLDHSLRLAAEVRSVAITSDGTRILTGGPTATLWDAKDGRALFSFPKLAETTMDSVAISGDGKLAATSGRLIPPSFYDANGQPLPPAVRARQKPGETCRLWDLSTKTELGAFRGADQLNQIAFSPDGKKIWTSDGNLWDTRTRSLLKTIRRQHITGPISFSTDGARLLAATSVGVELFDSRTGREIATIREARDSRCLLFSPTGQVLTCDGGPPFVFDVSTEKSGGATFGADESVLTYVTAVALSLDAKTALLLGADRKATLLDTATGRTVHTFQPPALCIALTDDGRFVLTGGEDNVARLWDAASGKQLVKYGGHTDAVTSIGISEDGETIVTASLDRHVSLWDRVTGRQVASIQENAGPVQCARLSSDGKRLLTACIDSSIASGRIARLWNVATGEVIHTFPRVLGEVLVAGFASNDRKVLLVSDEGQLFDVETGALEHTFPVGGGGRQSQIAIAPNGKTVLAANYDASIGLWDTSGKLLQEFKGQNRQIMSVAFTGNGKHLIAGGLDGTHFWPISTHVEQNRRLSQAASAGVTAARFSDDGQKVLLTTRAGQTHCWDTTSGQDLGVLTGQPPSAGSGKAVRSSDGSRIVTSLADGAARLVDAQSGTELCRLTVLDDGSIIASTPDGFYTASRKAVSHLGFCDGLQYYPFNQFDVMRNRTDIVLDRIGIASENSLSIYRALHEKRLSFHNVKSRVPADDIRLPEIEIQTSVSFSTESKEIDIQVEATDPQSFLERIHIDVNGVPLHGKRGFDLQGQQTRRWSGDFRVELSNGKNRIDAVAVSASGAESVIRTIHVDCNVRSSVPDLYVLAVGVSEYPAFPLQYADKDAKDLVEALRLRKSEFGSVKVLQLLNQEVTRENVLEKSSEFLKSATVDDIVIAFFAGHGTLDGSRDYYFATVDHDFDAPAKRGLSYVDIEGLLERARSRRKLLLMDTCHSGELDQSDAPPASGGGGRAVRGNSARGLELQDPSTIRVSNSFRMLRELFSDLRRSTGTVVIASTGGAELAQESSRLKNGVFTSAVLSGLAGEADGDKNGRVLMSELRDYVDRKVRELTSGQQIPAARHENVVVDFSL